jgi:feruloyl esterase
MMVGNGGWNGALPLPAMTEPLRRGYAVAGTDTGHEGGRGTFAFGHPEKLTDFAQRAVHETVVKGKALTTAFYGGQPRYSYWNGCSSGGKQGLKEVQAYPEDFDGVIAGAPANNWVRLQAQSLVANIANLPKGQSAVLGTSQFAILNKGVLAQCDARDGLKDGEVQDPRACDFKASSLVCKAGDAAGSCLTAEQAAVADKIYAPVRMASGELVYPGMPPGSEMVLHSQNASMPSGPSSRPTPELLKPPHGPVKSMPCVVLTPKVPVRTLRATLMPFSMSAV